MPRLPAIIPRHRPGVVKGRPWCVDLSAKVTALLGETTGRRKEFFETKAAATDCCSDIRARAASFDDASKGLTGEDRLEAWTCKQLLKPYGATLLQATTKLVQELEATKRSVLVPTLVNTLLNDKKYEVATEDKPGKSATYKADLTHKLNRFAEDHPKAKMSDLTTELLETWLDTLEVGPVTRNNYRRILKLAFNYAIRKRWVAHNVAKDIEIAAESTSEVDALTVEEAAGLLRFAEGDQVPVVALGLFAGIRPSEVMRMQWSEIHRGSAGGGEIDAPNDDAGDVDVKAKKAKSAKRRIVPIRPVLAAYLDRFQERTGAIFPPGKWAWYYELRKIRARAGMSRWPHDAMRHTFCSMDYAHFQDLNGLVARMGHTDPNLIFSRYRRVCKAADAARFWTLLPEAK